MYGEISEVVVFSPIVGEQWRVAVGSTLWTMAPGVAVILGSPLAGRGSRRHLVEPVDGMASSVEHTILRVRPRWNAEGSTGCGLALVKVRTTSEGRTHACQGSCSRGSTRSWQHSDGSSVKHVRTACRRFAQGQNSTGNGGTMVGVGGRDSSHTRYAAWQPDAI